MKPTLICDVCGMHFTQPFVKIVQQLNCPNDDFTLLWDGEKQLISEKHLVYQHANTQFFLCVDFLNDLLTVEIQYDKFSPELEGTVIAEIPLDNFSSVKLDGAFAKTLLTTLTTGIV